MIDFIDAPAAPREPREQRRAAAHKRRQRVHHRSQSESRVHTSDRLSARKPQSWLNLPKVAKRDLFWAAQAEQTNTSVPCADPRLSSASTPQSDHGPPLSRSSPVAKFAPKSVEPKCSMYHTLKKGYSPAIRLSDYRNVPTNTKRERPPTLSH
jgi:hypothetical protein